MMNNPQKCLAPLCLQHFALVRGTLTADPFALRLSGLAWVPLGFWMSAASVARPAERPLPKRFGPPWLRKYGNRYPLPN
jgi:hypothetical protein